MEPSDEVVAKMNDSIAARNVLKLFISGRTQRSESAIHTVRALCEQELGGEFDLVVIDVCENPREAEERRILATPTVVKELPPPIRKVIGDLSDKEKVLIGLDLQKRT